MSRPAFYQQTLALIEEKKFEEALQRISYALSLRPRDAEFLVLKGNILQSLVNLAEARDAYTQALKIKLGHKQALESRQLCEKILGKSRGQQEIPAESWEELRACMLQQGRSAEALALAQRLSRQTQDAFAYWQDVLAKAGWKGRLTKDDKNQLQFDSDEEDFVADLSVVKDMPLSSLRLGKVFNLSPLKGQLLNRLSIFQGQQVTDLSPLKGMPLVNFQLQSSPINDISALKGMPLTVVHLNNTAISDISALKGAPLTEALLSDSLVRDVGPLQGAPLITLLLQNTPVSDISALRGAPLKTLRLDNCRKLLDLRPLAECKQLEYLSLPPVYKNLDFLRLLPSLKRLTYVLPQQDWERATATTEFWKAYDARKK